MKSYPQVLPRAASALVLWFALLLAGSIQAQTRYWDGGTANIATNGDAVSDGASGTWNTSLQNWDAGGSPHAAWTEGLDALFGLSGIPTTAGAGLITLGAPITANTLMITATNYIFGDNGSGNTLTVNTVSNTAAVTISNNIVNSTTFVKDGSGANTLILLGASPGFTGGVQVNGGILRFGASGATGTYGPQSFGDVSVASNATLQLYPYEASTYAQNISGAGSVAVQSTSSARQINLVGNSTFTGNFTVNSATAVITSLSDTAPNPLGYSTNVTIGTGASATTLKYAGSGDTTSRALTLAGTTVTTSLDASSLYGPLVWRGPALVGSTTPRILGLNGTSTYANEFAGTVADGATNMAVTKAGTGTWLLTGANTYSGGTTLNAGSLIITNDNALGISTGRVTFINGTASTLMGTLKSASNDVTLASTRTIYMGFTNAGGFGVADNFNLIVESYLTGTGSVQRANGGSGAVRFSNDTNDYTGDFSIVGGTAEFTSVANQGTASSLGKGKAATAGVIKLSTANTFSALRYVGTNNSTTTRPLDWMNLQNLNLEASGTGTISWLATGNLKSGSASAGLTLRGSNPGANTLGQGINDNGGMTSLFKTGSGQWLLTANNTFSGPTTVTGGTLSVGQDANLGAAPVSATPNSVALNGGALLASATFTLNANRGIGLGPLDTNVTGSGILEVASAQTLTYAGIIADRTSTNSGSLVKTGAGTLSLSGANTYTGDTTVTAGTLALTGAGTLGNGTNLVIGSGATLDVTGTAGLTLGASQILHATNGATATLAGNVNAGSGALVISYTNGTPTINVTSGSLTLAASTVTTVNVQNGGTLLPGGDYKLVSVSGAGAVSGAAPTALTVSGDVANTATLALTGGELYLHVPASSLTPPTLDGITMSGGSAILTFNGPIGQTYQVLTTTNMALPLVSWSPLASGTFAGSPVTYTNTPTSEPQRFFTVTSP